jgi:HD-like signal output (HDOD) protein
MYEAEREVLGVTDAEIGAHLLSLWGLPDTILEAVALHYTPSKAPSPILNVLTAVHLAFAIEYDQSNKIRDDNKSAVDKIYVSKLGLIEELPNLRNFCTAAMA